MKLPQLSLFRINNYEENKIITMFKKNIAPRDIASRLKVSILLVKKICNDYAKKTETKQT